MNKLLFIPLFVLLTFCVKFVKGQSVEDVHVFTDRDYCLSGDTVWFSVNVPEALSDFGNVVHVQLDNWNNSLISQTIVVQKEGKTEGFIPVPDSLSTGVYFISAFLNARANSSQNNINSKIIFVYNRFEESISEVNVPSDQNWIVPENLAEKIEIKTDKKIYKPRQKVKVEINLSDLKMKFVKLKASLSDPLSRQISGNYIFEIKGINQIPSIRENDGFLINGTVTDELGMPQAKTLVILSIPGNSSYFDYYFSGENGEFHFYLKKAAGTANVVIQAISEENKFYKIILNENYLQRTSPLQLQNIILTNEQVKFNESFLNGKYIDKIFNPGNPVITEYFEMPARFPVPFYGNPNHRIKPKEFIDLPDFREISRELLPGVQYRIKDGEVTFRMLNVSRGMLFENEPLKLLNGIPVLNNNLFSRLKSTDIEFIDIVQRERMFGDLVFKGVLSVQLKSLSNSWLAQQPNLFQFKVNCFQKPVLPAYKMPAKIPANKPDVRQVYLWEEIKQGNNIFEFDLADFKGKVEIVVEGLLENNKVFNVTEIIEVK